MRCGVGKKEKEGTDGLADWAVEVVVHMVVVHEARPLGVCLFFAGFFLHFGHAVMWSDEGKR